MKAAVKSRNGWFVGLGINFLTAKATLPAAWNPKLSGTIGVTHKTVTEQVSFSRRSQGAEDADLEDICQGLEDDGCMCKVLSNGRVSLECAGSTCRWCDANLERCGIKYSSLEFGQNGTPPNYIVGRTLSFEYTTGETVEVAQSSCDVSDGFPNSCSKCVAYVNGEECTSCEMCEDRFSYSIDCENLATNSSFNKCLADAPEYGIFQGLVFNTCQYIEPTNDECSDPTPLQFGVAVIGRTDGATEDSISSSCSLVDGKDVWYSVEGTGNTIVATTCSLATPVGTIIDVFSGPDSCEDLVCIPSTKSSCSAIFSGGTISWSSESGVLYHLRVVTEESDDQFAVTVWNVPLSENTACASSVVFTSINTVGSTHNLSDQLETDICGEIGLPGLWYQVTAIEDGVMRASTCSNKTSIDTAITVMTGKDCETFTCVKSANSFDGTAGCTDIGTIVEWNVSSSQTYFVYIRGMDSTGIFGVSVEPLHVPNNDVCAAAAVVSSEDGIIQGNTENATEDFIVEAPCGEEAYITRRGVWYKIAGSAKFVRATVCPSVDEISISVYMGECTNLVCAAESSYTNCASLWGHTVSWEALEGVEYFLFVYAPYFPGSFDLLFDEFEPSTNIMCTNAEGPLIPTNQTIVASTVNAISDGISGCVSGFNNSPGLWYYVLGKEGLTYRVDTCSEETNFDTEISIYRGSCHGELECIGGNDESCGGVTSSVQWKTEEGLAYYIKIHGHLGAVGDFGMTVSSYTPPKNDVCLDSTVLSTSNDETVIVSTAGSTPDVIPVCSFASHLDYPGTWYQIEGNDKTISISTCPSLTNGATTLSVFSGSCDDLSCVAEGVPEHTCQGTHAHGAIFLAEEGNTYFIFLQSDGSGDEVGLTITEIEGPGNDFCQRASNVVIDGGEVAGTTVGASGGTPTNECYFDPSIPDVWYFVDGSGDILQATACSSEFLYFSMAVLHGGCTQLSCIAIATSEPECATVLFQSVVGETYYISFQGLSESGSGMFSLSVNTSSV